MSELRATPIPWTAVRKHPHVWAIDALSGDTDLGHVKWHSLADVYGCDDMGAAGRDKAKANAHLIAAAPELYESLKIAAEALEKTANDTLIGRNAAEDARTVLAKARGEHQ